MLHVSPRDQSDAKLPEAAPHTKLCRRGDEQMVALTPLRGGENASTKLVPLESVSGPDRAIPKDWIGKGNPPLNEKFVEYLRPMIGELLGIRECV